MNEPIFIIFTFFFMCISVLPYLVFLFEHFTTRHSNASTVLGVIVLSICLSHACFVTKLKNILSLFWCHMKGQSLQLSVTNSGWQVISPSTWNLCKKWPTSFEKHRLWQISADNIPTLRASEKSSIITNRKLATGFTTSCRWNAYVTSKSPKGWFKMRICHFKNKNLFLSNYLCYKVSMWKLSVAVL